MAVTHAIDGTPNSRVRIESVALTASAENGTVATGTLVIDDPDGTFATTGHKDYQLTEDDCASAITYKGFLGRRGIRRGPTRAGAGRQIEVTVRDLNDLLTRNVIRGGGKRPRESVGTRLTWILGSSYLSSLVADNGFVDYPSTMMDPNDYRYSSRPGDVIGDCATRVNFNFFVYPDPATGDPSLWFQDSNTSTDYSSSLRISDDIDDIDHTTTFESSLTSEFTRDPEDVWSHVLENYEGGRVYRFRASTQTAFTRREAIAPTSSVKRRAQAIAQAEKYLDIHAVELDEMTDTILLPSSKVNLLREGMRVQARYQHLTAEGYGDFTWWRVLERTVRHVVSPGGIPEEAGEPLYSVDLRMSPQECTSADVGPDNLVQYALQNGGEETFLDFAVAPTPGNMLVCAVGQRDEITLGPLAEPPPAGWTRVPLVGGAGTFVHARFAGVSEYAHADLIYRVCQPGDTGIDYGLNTMKILMEWTGVGAPIGAGSAEYNAQNLAAISATSGAPGLPAVVIGALITRLDDPSGEMAAATPGRIPTGTAAPPTGSVGHDELFVLWGTTGGGAVTLTGTQSGATIDGDGYWWGVRIGAFRAVCA